MIELEYNGVQFVRISSGVWSIDPRGRIKNSDALNEKLEELWKSLEKPSVERQ